MIAQLEECIWHFRPGELTVLEHSALGGLHSNNMKLKVKPGSERGAVVPGGQAARAAGGGRR